MYKSKNKKKDLGFFIVGLGLAFLVETVIYIFLRAYEYFPYIIPNSRKNDGVIGNIFSQFSISSVALFVCILKIPFAGVILASVIFYLIEHLFLYLGIYRVYWYRPLITLITLITSFELAKRWYALVMSKNTPKMQYIHIMMGVLALYLPTTNWIGILSGYYEIKDNILVDPFISHAVVAIPKYITQINIIYFLIKYRANWVWKFVGVVVIFFIDIALYYTKIMVVKDGWLLIYSGISVLSIYLYTHLMKKLLYSD